MDTHDVVIEALLVAVVVALDPAAQIEKIVVDLVVRLWHPTQLRSGLSNPSYSREMTLYQTSIV